MTSSLLRPLAALLASVLVVGLWAQTLAVPAAAPPFMAATASIHG